MMRKRAPNGVEDAADSGGSNGEHGQQASAISVAILEEQVRLDELILKDLMERKSFIAKKFETTRSERDSEGRNLWILSCI